jgi:kynurenine formamidase
MSVSGEPPADSNWGRWGQEDQIGALNLIGTEKRLAAAGLVRSGRTVSLSRPIPTDPGVGNPRPAQHFVKRSGPSEAGGAALDFLMIGWHGYTCTHLDALCHVWGPEGMWNGGRAEEAITFDGAVWGGIEHWRQGIITRGVLLDVPAHRNEPFVTVERPVTGRELIEIARDTDVKLEPGDAIVVYCGRDAWDSAHDSEGQWSSESRKPGLDGSCLEFFRNNDCAMVVWDMLDATVQDPPSRWGVHAGIFQLGLALLDNAELEELAQACREEKRHEFMLVVAPLRLIGGTGSPVNPLAVF